MLGGFYVSLTETFLPYMQLDMMTGLALNECMCGCYVDAMSVDDVWMLCGC